MHALFQNYVFQCWQAPIFISELHFFTWKNLQLKYFFQR